MSALAEWLASLRFEVSINVSAGRESEAEPQGDCYAATERSEVYPVGFRVEPIE